MTRSSTSGRCRDVCLLAGDAGHGHRRVSRLSRYLFFVGLARSHAGPSLRRRRPDAAVAPVVAGSVRAERTAGTAPIGRVRTESTRKNTVKKKGNKSTCSPHALQFSDSVMQSRNTCHKIYLKKNLVIRRKKKVVSTIQGSYLGDLLSRPQLVGRPYHGPRPPVGRSR